MLLRITAILLFTLSSFLPCVAQKGSPLQSGPMLGYVEMMQANIWIQTKDEVPVYLVYWNLEKPDEKFRSATVKTSTENSLIATFKLRHLMPGKDYMYEIYSSGKKVTLDYVTRFKTQALWQFRTEPPSLVIAVGSCFYVNDEPYDRPGKAYGGSADIFKSIRSNNPDIMLWLGDNVYYREPEFFSKARLDYRNSHTRSIPGLQPLLSAAVNLATWDDHDYGPNDSDRSYRYKNQALEIFKRYWLNPGYGHDGVPGVFTRYEYSDVEFFILDDRFHRAPNQLKDSSKTYWGEAQFNWLKDALVNSRATFKFIVNGNQVLNVHSKHESVSGGYPAAAKNLMDFLAEQKVNGVVFLSGDRHHTELLKVDRPGMYPLYEFTSSPLTSGLHTEMDEEAENPLRVPNTLVNTVHNFGLMRVEGTRRNRILTLQTLDSNGTLIWDHKIEANQLRHE